MATKSKDTEKKTVKDQNITEASTISSTNSNASIPSTEDLLKIFAGLQEQVEKLSSKVNEDEGKVVNQVVNPVVNTVKDESSARTDKLLEILANRKQDKEVVIVHNREIIGGGSTTLKLTGLVINFHKLGEERVLNWQQFEECVSKYRRFFDKEIVLLSSDYQEIAERYSIRCVQRGSNKRFTRDELTKINTLDVHALEDYYNSLTKQDKDFLCSYWLGKCYEKAPGFYDRYKIELLNRLSNSHAFDNLLTMMNNEYRNN